jgi:gas vesicle protein
MAFSLIVLSIKSFFKKVKDWCIKYWQVVVGALIPIFAILITRTSSPKKVHEKTKEFRDKELEVLKNASKQEVEDIKAASKKYVDTIKKVEKKYGKLEKNLDSEKKILIAKLVDEGTSDQDALTDKIAEIMGFKKYN